MKKENKKKVVTLSAMAALLAVVLGMGGKTYAKYFTENQSQADTATVAKWGLVLNQQANSAFKQSYTDGSSAVIAKADHEIVAPGTDGTINYKVTGTAEVNAKVTFSIVNYKPVSLEYGSVNYNPITWTYNSNPINPNSWTETFYYEAGSPSANFSIDLAWAWDFSDGSEGTATANDKNDTILGQLSHDNRTSPYTDNDGDYGAASTVYTFNLALSYEVKVVIEQVETIPSL